ncbi:hypothetical protein QR77_18360 [Streptomyces sp. 150FB]|nr:hypothetical protein QR77_18360 [Streptomyces sp. 150FB]
MIQQVRIFDGVRVIRAGDVLISGAKIAQVASRITPDRDWKVVSGRGRTLLPGLIDAHVHISSVDDMATMAQHGVTTVLEMFGAPQAATANRSAAASRNDVADFHSSGWGASGTGGFLSSRTPDVPTVGGPQDAEAFVAARVAEGSEYIKLFVQDPSTSGLPEMSEATIAAVATAARRRNLHSIAHAPYRWAFDTAHNANVSIITHVPLDDTIDRQWALRAAARKQIFVPTLVMSKAQVESQGSSASPCCVSPSATTGSGGMKAVPGLSYDNARDSVAALHAVGLPILVGTDSHAPGAGISGPASVPFGSSMHTELALLVDAGLSPVQALRAATALNASLFRLADRGRVKSGFQADLLLVTGDPTSDITATKDIAEVWRRGAPLKKSDGS